MNVLRLIARPLLASPFIIDGVSALARPADHLDAARQTEPLLEKAGVPAPSESTWKRITQVTGAVSVAAGVALATGTGDRAAAAVLAGIGSAMAVAKYPVLGVDSRAQRRENLSPLVRQLALVGGLLIASTDRQGRPSALWAAGNRRQVRQAVRTARDEAWDQARQVYAA